MSRRPTRKRPPLSGQEQLRRALGPLDGMRVAGGCASCDAYQTVAPVSAGVWALIVRHDDWCPWLVERERSARAGVATAPGRNPGDAE